MTQKKTLKLPKLIGHRGVKDLCPENTLVSISRAFEIGLNFVEVDVKISKDRVPILLHDDTIDRTTNGSGLAIDYDYENIKKLDAGKFFYKENTNIFVPKLEDILSLCANYNGNLNIELKPNKNFEKENVYQIYKVIKIMDFGAFVNFMGSTDGLVHISQLKNERVEKVEDVISEGDIVKVKVLDIDSRGKIKLSMKAVDAEENA